MPDRTPSQQEVRDMDAMIRQVLVRNGITFINDPGTARAIDTLAYSAAEANIRLTAQSATL